MTKDQINSLAIKGAKLRIKEIEEELYGLEKFLMKPVGEVKVKKQKLHWTQTVAGKKKLGRVMRKAWKLRHENSAKTK